MLNSVQYRINSLEDENTRLREAIEIYLLMDSGPMYDRGKSRLLFEAALSPQKEGAHDDE